MSRVPFFTPGLPQLPLNTDPKLEGDLRDLYTALRTLADQIGQFGGFEEAFDGFKNIANATYTAGPHKRKLYCEALEVMPYGAALNLTDSGGTLKARFANATNNTRPCYGINNTPGNCAIGDIIEVALPGCYVTSIGGLTRGLRYFLQTANGTIGTGIPAAVGNVQQAVGFAIETNMLFFFPTIHWFTV